MCSSRIRFRINKVSRRKDGQSFKLQLQLSNAKGLDASEVEPVYTSTIQVLSKRKSSTTAQVNKRRKMTLKEFEDMEFRSRNQMLQAIDGLHLKIDTIMKMIQIQGTVAQQRLT